MVATRPISDASSDVAGPVESAMDDCWRLAVTAMVCPAGTRNTSMRCGWPATMERMVFAAVS
jgi:hypothetical protein